MAVRVEMASNKGGTGKSTLINLMADAAARAGYTVLVVDLDPQGNTTRRMAIDAGELLAARHPGVADVLDPESPVPVADAVVPCGWETDYAHRIQVLPSLANLPLLRRSKEFAEPGAVNRLKFALDNFDDRVHITLIDLNPAMDHLFENAFVATDEVYLVTELDTIDGVNGGRSVAAWLLKFAARMGRPDVTLAGVVVNKFNEESAVQRRLLEELPSLFTFPNGDGDEMSVEILQPPLPLLVSLSNAQHRSLPVTAIAHPVVKRVTKAADAYVQHILARSYSTGGNNA